MTVDAAGLARRLAPRDDVLVLEAMVGDDPGERRYSADEGPFRSYERVVRYRETAHGTFELDQRVRFRTAIPVFSVLFHPLIARALRKAPGPGYKPVWLLPDRLGARASSIVAAMCLFHVVGGVLYALLTNLLTFASHDLGDGSAGEQSVVFAVARIGALLTIVVMAFADRVGRRRVAIWAAGVSVLLTIASAAAPSLVTLAFLQTFSRNLAIAAMLASDTLSVEEIPPGSRASAQGLAALSYGLGTGAVVILLPLADLGDGAWRLVFLVALLCAPVIAIASRHLPESRRFTHRERFVPEARRVRPARFVYLAVLLVLVNLFVSPASQLQNDYLRTDRGFSGSRITLFLVVTSVLGTFGVLWGSRLADRRSRRMALVPGLLAAGVLGAVFFMVSGAPMWITSTIATGVGALSIPALGVLAPEMFPTARRGTARGALSAIATGGSALGLLVAGVLVDRLDYGAAFGWLMIAPLLATVMAVWAPESSGVELEELNENVVEREGADDPTRASP